MKKIILLLFCFIPLVNIYAEDIYSELDVFLPPEGEYVHLENYGGQNFINFDLTMNDGAVLKGKFLVDTGASGTSISLPLTTERVKKYIVKKCGTSVIEFKKAS